MLPYLARRPSSHYPSSIVSSPLVFLCACLCLSAFTCVRSHAQVDVLTQHNDNARTGANLRETVLTPTNVNKTQFGMLFKRAVDDQLYTQPLMVTGIAVDGGTHDIVYVTTVNNSVYAFDANDTQASPPIWHVNFGTPANLHSTNFGCLDINGQMGIIGTPVIDKARGVLYVVALTRAGASAGPGTGFTQRLHALDLATGADLPESPVVIKAAEFRRADAEPAAGADAGERHGVRGICIALRQGAISRFFDGIRREDTRASERVEHFTDRVGGEHLAIRSGAGGRRRRQRVGGDRQWKLGWSEELQRELFEADAAI